MRIHYQLYGRGPLTRIDVFDGGRSVYETSRLQHSEYGSPDVVFFPSPITAPGTTGEACVAKVADYDRPVGLIGLSTGMCCQIALVVYPASPGRYQTTYIGFGRSGFDIQADGSLAFVGGDARFVGLFTDIGGSNWPIHIERFEHGHLFDVSKEFPRLIAADASGHWKEFLRNDDAYAEIGQLEAWVADECRIGNGPRAWQVARQEVARGRLSGVAADAVPDHYISELSYDLIRWHYCASSA